MEVGKPGTRSKLFLFQPRRSSNATAQSMKDMRLLEVCPDVFRHMEAATFP